MTLFTIHDAESEGDEISGERVRRKLLISVTEKDMPSGLTDSQALCLETRSVVLDKPKVIALRNYLQAWLDEKQPPLWWEDRDNVTALAEWMDFECYFNDASSAIRLFEKPWKWTREFGLYQAHEATDVEELRERLVDAIHDDNLSGEEVVAAWTEEAAE